VADEVPTLEVLATGAVQAGLVGALVKGGVLAAAAGVTGRTSTGVAVAGATVEAASNSAVVLRRALRLAGGAGIAGGTCAGEAIDQVLAAAAIFAGRRFAVIAVRSTVAPFEAGLAEADVAFCVVRSAQSGVLAR
jgi:hypothetical protein